MLKAALAKLQANVEALSRESEKLDAAEQAKPVEQSERWWGAYYSLENSFIHEVRGALESDGFNQSDLARILGVSRARVSQILNGGEENFKLETIAKIATALNRDIALRFIQKDEEVLVVKSQRCSETPTPPASADSKSKKRLPKKPRGTPTKTGPLKSKLK